MLRYAYARGKLGGCNTHETVEAVVDHRLTGHKAAAANYLLSPREKRSSLPMM